MVKKIENILTTDKDERIIKLFNLKTQIEDLKKEYDIIEEDFLQSEEYKDINKIISSDVLITIKQGATTIINKEYRQKQIDKKTTEIEELKNTLDNPDEIKKTKNSLIFKKIDNKE